jgi:histidyl-tRNA synthetase
MVLQGVSHFPNSPGAYAIILDLARPRRLAIAGLKGSRLAAGRYAYGGSARGPGGIRARLGRHLVLKKKKHWHVDYLRAAARVAGAAAFMQEGECGLVRRLLELPGALAPLPGFGSTDCQACVSHLVGLPPAARAQDIFDFLQADFTWVRKA